MTNGKIKVDLEALKAVLEYLWCDEERCFFECWSGGDREVKEGIFWPLVKLQAAIDEVSPEQLLKESFEEWDEPYPSELSLV
ncbi:MAG: hypothetical protein ABSG86_22825 [Thermoguttaceae bacterium]|jgi:hypothetical protein